MPVVPLFATIVPNVLAWAMPQGYEWLVILAIGLLIFGKRIPGMAKGIGQGIWEFKKGLKGGQQEAEETDEQKQLAADEARAPMYDTQTGKPLNRQSAGA